MRISVIGTGYVGLVSGVCFAEKGHKVVCVDNNSSKIDKINNGYSPIYEVGLKELIKNLNTSLTASTDFKDALINSDVSFIAVGTPFDGTDIDLMYVREVSKEIGRVLKTKVDYHVVIVKSTVVPGTTDDIVLPLLEEYSGKKAGINFGVGMNPEFLREGEAIDDFMNPDRIVLGGIDSRTHNTMTELYSIFNNDNIILTNNKTAEMIKYASNSLFATMISFSNEIANLCGVLGEVDSVDVMNGVHLDKRISTKMDDGTNLLPGIISYLKAGCGFGGSCFPKDIKALISNAAKYGQSMSLLNAVIDINNTQPYTIINLLKKHYSSINGINVAVLGLAFKPETDDMRESPAIPIVNSLIKENAIVRAFDPIAQTEAKKVFNNKKIIYCNTVNEAINEAEIVIILTSWKEFKDLPNILKLLGTNPIVIDGRRMLEKNSVKKYEGIGL